MTGFMLHRLKPLVFVGVFICSSVSAYAQIAPPPYILTTIAGASALGDAGPASQATLIHPAGVAVDGAGNVYVADTGNNRIRKIATDGTITTIAGTGMLGSTSDGVPATVALISTPQAIAFDQSGNLYIAPGPSGLRDPLRKISPSGILTSVPSGTMPLMGVAIDRQGNIYACGTAGLYKSTPDGKSSVLGSPFLATAVAVDNVGGVYAASGNLIYRVDATGSRTAIVGTSFSGFSGDGGSARTARLNFVQGMAVDSNGNLYIADTNNHRIRKVSGDIINTIAGTGTAGFSGDGGSGAAAMLAYPRGLAFDTKGNLYIADQDNDRIRVLSPSGVITTLAGGVQFVSEGSPAATAVLSRPANMILDANGNIYFSDRTENRVRKISTTGTITTVAGNGSHGFSGDGGPAAAAQLNSPLGIALDNRGNLYIADVSNDLIRVVGTDGKIRTMAGNGELTCPPMGGTCTAFSGDGGPAISAQLNAPSGVAVDGQGALYVADTLNHRIRRIGPDGIIISVAGDGTTANPSSINSPRALAFDQAGNLYIAESKRIRMRSIAGAITTVAGGGNEVIQNGIATNAAFGLVTGLALDGRGNVYVADESDHRVRVINSSGSINTLAGTGRSGYTGDGGLAATAQLASPAGVAVDPLGAVYIADQVNQRIRKLTPNATAQLTAISGSGNAGLGSTVSLVVQLSTASGTALPNTAVTFLVSSGAATLSAPSATTSADGLATVTAKLGSTLGTVTITASVPGLPVVMFTVTVIDAVAPTITSGGVVGAGSSVPAVRQISPNGLITIYGKNFTPESAPLRVVSPSDLVNGRVPTVLGGVCVQIGSRPAPMVVVSSTQLNVQVPSLTSTGPVPVQVVANCGEAAEIGSNIETVILQAATPEFLFFARNPDGKNPVAAVNPITGSYVGAPGLIPGAAFVSAKSGDVLTIFLTGLGLTAPPIEAGDLPAGIARIESPTAVQIGETKLQESDVLYVGITPGNAGLYQLNIRVPANIPNGSIPIMLTIGTFSTPPGAYLFVQQ